MSRKFAEQHILGSILTEPPTLWRVSAELGPEDFSGSHQLLFKILCLFGGPDGSFERSEFIKFIEAEECVDEVGGVQYIEFLVTRCRYDVKTFEGFLGYMKLRKVARTNGELSEKAGLVEAAVNSIVNQMPLSICVMDRSTFLEEVSFRMSAMGHCFFAGEFDSYSWLNIYEEPHLSLV